MRFKWRCRPETVRMTDEEQTTLVESLPAMRRAFYEAAKRSVECGGSPRKEVLRGLYDLVREDKR